MEFFEPKINADTAQYWEGCREHELRLRRCTQCGRLRTGAYLCPECLSAQWEPAAAQAEGTLYSFVVMERPFHPSVADKVPYIIATVDLADGVRILTNLEGTSPEDLHCGDAVTITFTDSETYSRPVAHKKGAMA